MTKCNAQPKPVPDYFQENVNVRRRNSNQTFPSVSEMSIEELKLFITKIHGWYDQVKEVYETRILTHESMTERLYVFFGILKQKESNRDMENMRFNKRLCLDTWNVSVS